MSPRSSWCVIAAAVIAIAASACGSGGTSSNSAGTTTPTRRPSAAPAEGTGAPKVAVATWKLATPVASEPLVTDGIQLIVLGGLDATKFSTNAIVQVNPNTGQSQGAGTLAEAVHDSAGARVGSKMVDIGGGGPSENGSADSQHVTPDGHASIVGKMPQPRSDHVAAAVGGKIYVLGGYDGANIVGDVLATTNGTSFTTVGVLPVPVRYPAIAVLGKSIYLFGGVASTKGTDTAAIQRLDNATGRLAAIGQLPTTVAHASAVVLAHQVYLLGGYVNSVQLSDQVLRFDPTTGTTSSAGRLPEPNSDAAAIVVNHVGYLVGGKSIARDPLATVLTITPR